MACAGSQPRMPVSPNWGAHERADDGLSADLAAFPGTCGPAVSGQRDREPHGDRRASLSVPRLLWPDTPAGSRAAGAWHRARRPRGHALLERASAPGTLLRGYLLRRRAPYAESPALPGRPGVYHL